MDYTKVPRSLIYKDRDDLDDFPISMQFGFPSMEGNFLEALEQRPFIKESYEASELILKIFNNARYITTLICLENHPNHYFRKYLRIAGSDDRSITIANHTMPATMALVKNYLCHYMPNRYSGSKIVEDITNNFNTEAWKEMTQGGQDDFYKLVIEDRFNHPGWIVDKHFEPRDIRDAVGDPFITVHDISENIDFILESLEKGVEIFDEEIAPLNAMYKKVESWFPSDLDDNLHKELALGKIEKRLKKLDPNNSFEFFNLMNDIENSLYNGTPLHSKTKEEINNYMKKTMGVSMDEIEAASVKSQDDDENEKLKTKIKEFEEKNQVLEAENKQLKQKYQELKETLEQKKENPDVDILKNQLEDTRALLEEYETSDSKGIKYRFILEKGEDVKLTLRERNIIEYVIHSSAIKHLDDNTNANMCRLIGKENTVRTHFNISKRDGSRSLSKDEKKHIKMVLDSFDVDYKKILKDHL